MQREPFYDEDRISAVVLEEFEQTYHLLHCFPDVSSKNRRDTESLVCIVLIREAMPIPD